MHRIVSVAVIVAGRQQRRSARDFSAWILAPAEAEAFWTAFLHTLARRGSRGLKLVISDHEGIKAAVAKVLNATWQRCRVRFMHNVLAHAGR